MPSIPMAPGQYTDSGYRFRKNTFERKDFWIPYIDEGKHVFYDVMLFNSDTVSVASDYMRIADMYYRLDIN